ncbi:MAG: SOS response-associated peptidase [Desulfovibrio sp.]|nr:SOS response-associated peptidase [Desulfovibrio sp.]
MCCRYYIKESALDFLQRLGANNFNRGDVHPGDYAPAIIAREANPVVARLRWGIASKYKSLVINARSETLWDKPMFRESIVKRRCVLPADCFFEWDANKRRSSFWPSERSLCQFIVAKKQDHGW